MPLRYDETTRYGKGTPSQTNGDPVEPPFIQTAFSSAYGIRTRVCALRGHYPGPLDECAMSYHNSTAQRLESVCANWLIVKARQGQPGLIYQRLDRDGHLIVGKAIPLNRNGDEVVLGRRQLAAKVARSPHRRLQYRAVGAGYGNGDGLFLGRVLINISWLALALITYSLLPPGVTCPGRSPRLCPGQSGCVGCPGVGARAVREGW